jgi:hypothetical protein
VQLYGQEVGIALLELPQALRYDCPGALPNKTEMLRETKVGFRTGSIPNLFHNFES